MRVPSKFFLYAQQSAGLQPLKHLPLQAYETFPSFLKPLCGSCGPGLRRGGGGRVVGGDEWEWAPPRLPLLAHRWPAPSVSSLALADWLQEADPQVILRS